MIDNSDFYRNDVAKANRSRMNVPFQLADSALDKLFLEESFAAGLHALKGHRVVGGMRASIYNAMPLEGVKALTDFMVEFERRQRLMPKFCLIPTASLWGFYFCCRELSSWNP